MLTEHIYCIKSGQYLGGIVFWFTKSFVWIILFDFSQLQKISSTVAEEEIKA